MALAAALVLAVPAQAAFPGANGKIAFESAGGVIEVINPDGTGRATLTNGLDPAWSPDGARIAFERADGIYVALSDGSGAIRIVEDVWVDDTVGDPAWSPDGTKIALIRHGGCDRNGCSQSRLYTTNPDGTGTVEIVTGVSRPAGPAWSPDGTRLIATDNGNETYARLFTVNADGTGLQYISCACSATYDRNPNWSPNGARYVFSRVAPSGFISGTIASSPFTVVHPQPVAAAWAPDGSRIALAHVVQPCSPPCHNDLFTIDPSGANELNLTNDLASQGNPDWQPIPISAYPRPKAASPQHISLVPAYEQCTSPNGAHGPPLGFPSCAPPQREPGQLTVGTPDSNGRPAKNVGELWIQAVLGVPSTPADEADVRIYGQVTDVRLASDLSDYTGSLEGRVTLRITDKDNTPHPGGPGAATVEDLTYTFPIPCTATADTTVGSACPFDTTAEALLPGAVKEGRRAIWQLGQLSVHDAGGDVFLRQGVFVP